MASSPAFRRILVPVDFSDAGEAASDLPVSVDIEGRQVAISKSSVSAIEAAARLCAQHDESELRLIHATPAYDHSRVYRGSTGRSVLGGALEEIHKEAVAASDAVLNAVGEAHCSGQSFSIASQPGHPLRVILDQAKDFDADLLVIAASTHGAVARFFLGSVADRVIREAPCPVMVIPGQV